MRIDNKTAAKHLSTAATVFIIGFTVVGEKLETEYGFNLIMASTPWILGTVAMILLHGFFRKEFLVLISDYEASCAPATDTASPASSFDKTTGLNEEENGKSESSNVVAEDVGEPEDTSGKTSNEEEIINEEACVEAEAPNETNETEEANAGNEATEQVEQVQVDDTLEEDVSVKEKVETNTDPEADDSKNLIDSSLDSYEARLEAANRKAIERKADIFKTVNDYTLRMMAGYLSKKDISTLLDNIKRMAYGQTDECLGISFGFGNSLRSPDLRHFAWNVGERLGVPRSQRALFIKKSFPQELKEASLAYLEANLRDFVDCTIKIDVPDKGDYHFHDEEDD